MTTARDGSLPRLENWRIYKYVGTKIAEGDIYNDTRWPDGTHIYTSEILSVSGDEIQTRNTLYKLGRKMGRESKQ
jgi:hypothetical protein